MGPKGLPLQSPSSKGWDQFKATRSDMFKDDINRKKHRQDSIVEQTLTVR